MTVSSWAASRTSFDASAALFGAAPAVDGDSVVKVIDQVDDGKGNFRFWVVPDAEEKPWPPQEHVRQGTKVMGWVILNRVPLWYELWRRFNLFPPDYQERPPSLIDTLLPKAGRGAK